MLVGDRGMLVKICYRFFRFCFGLNSNYRCRPHRRFFAKFFTFYVYKIWLIILLCFRERWDLSDMGFKLSDI